MIERDVCGTTGTSLLDIQLMPALDVLQHSAAARQERAADRMWELQVRMWRWIPAGIRTQIHASLAHAVQPGREKSPFEQCGTTQERLCLIGCDIAVHGEDWLRSHPEQRLWLRENGYTPEQAVTAERQWTRQMYDRHRYKNRPAWMDDDGHIHNGSTQRPA